MECRLSFSWIMYGHIYYQCLGRREGGVTTFTLFFRSISFFSRKEQTRGGVLSLIPLFYPFPSLIYMIPRCTLFAQGTLSFFFSFFFKTLTRTPKRLCRQVLSRGEHQSTYQEDIWDETGSQVLHYSILCVSPAFWKCITLVYRFTALAVHNDEKNSALQWVLDNKYYM